MRLFLMTATAVGFTLSTIMLAGQAVAVQDTPDTQNGVETVCTGVGSAKDDPRWKDYPVKLVMATSGGAFLANAHIAIAKGGKTLAQTDCDAPWLLIKAAPGRYTATASLNGGNGQNNGQNNGQSHSASFAVGSGGGQKEITIAFQRPSNAPSQ